MCVCVCVCSSKVYVKIKVVCLNKIIFVFRKYGGIFLDNDAYLIRNVNNLRKKELSIGRLFGSRTIENSIIISHRDSQALRLILTSFVYYSTDLPSHYSSKQVSDILHDMSTDVNVVDNFILKSSVKHLMYDNIPDFSDNSQIHVLNLNTKPRDGYQTSDANYSTKFADDLLERHFNLNTHIRRHANAIGKVLFDGLEP